MITLGAAVQSDTVTSRGLNKSMKVATRIELVDHKVNVLPLHFQNVAQTRPGGEWDYEARTKGYQIRKGKTQGHQRPNVFSGDMERAVLSSARVTATSKKGTLRARGSGRSSLRGPRREEIEAVSAREEQDLAQRWGETVTALIQQPENQRKVRQRNAAGQFI